MQSPSSITRTHPLCLALILDALQAYCHALPLTEGAVRTLLQVASKGVISPEDRTRIPSGLSDAQLLQIGVWLWELSIHKEWPIGVLVTAINPQRHANQGAS